MLRLPFSANHRGLSGINKNPMNIISDGKPANPSIYLKKVFDSLHAHGLFLYPLKTSENQRLSDVSREYRKKPCLEMG